MLRKFGTMLIVLSCISLVLLLLPIVKAYIPQSPIRQNITNQSFISIPKINAYAPIVFDIDPWDASVYTPALKKGVAHARGSARPGGSGTTFLFAHSSGTWDLTQYNTVFFRLGELQAGDKIMINFDKRKYMYVVRRKEVVGATEVKKIFADKSSDLVLQTCTPPGTSFARLLVYGYLTN